MMIEKNRDELADWLERYFGVYYDVNVLPDDMEPLKMRCDLHVNNQKYFLFKKNVMWEANCHEYVYVFSVPRLTPEVYKNCERVAYENGMDLIEPKKDHMYTYITCLILADETEPEAVKALKKCRIEKSFRFSLHGWMELHTAVLDRENGRTYTNRSGREYAKLFNSFLKNKKSKGEQK